jgi:hypothetical protein
MVLLLLLLVMPVTQVHAQSRQAAPTSDALFQRIESLDTAVFDAFNRCDLKKFSSFFTRNVEFYQDTEGVTWTRQKLVKDIKTYICGKVRRELIPGTLEVYPIKGFGAVEIGDHRFCEQGTDKCEGIAKFIHIWQNRKGVWMITRVISYDHRAAPNNP